MFRQLDKSDIGYYLISFDKNGDERTDVEISAVSEVEALLSDRTKPVTDVFVLSHGWKGDVPAAKEQNDAWIGQMGQMSADRKAIRDVSPGFNPLIIGLHWPSMPWGDEKLEQESGAKLLSGDEKVVSKEAVAKAFSETLGENENELELLRNVLNKISKQSDSPQLDPSVAQALQDLRAGLGLSSDTDIPGDSMRKTEAWDPGAIYASAYKKEQKLLGGGKLIDALLSPLRQLSFWKMKDRARKVGENGVAKMLRRLQNTAPESTKFHLMGHSFGCIVVSAAIAGPKGETQSTPVHSLFLVQGALSLWSYCDNIDGEPGYFNKIMKEKLVTGPIVTTRSKFDYAVGKYYPMGAGLAGQKVLGAELPTYGGSGTFGLQGLGDIAENIAMGNALATYSFKPGMVHNLEASGVIKSTTGASGAHSDISHPEVAHAAWQGILTGRIV